MMEHSKTEMLKRSNTAQAKIGRLSELTEQLIALVGELDNVEIMIADIRKELTKHQNESIRLKRDLQATRDEIIHLIGDVGKEAE